MWMIALVVPMGLLLLASAASASFVAAGASGTLLFSEDGEDWYDETVVPSLNQVRYGVAFGDGLWVTVGSAGSIYTSVDGKEWVPRVSNTAQILYDVAYNDGRWVAVGGLSTIVTSNDGGMTWTASQVPPAGPYVPILRSITNDGAGTWVIVGSSGWTYRSTDNADTWEGNTANAATYLLTGVTHTGTQFVLVGQAPNANLGAIVRVSDDGELWTPPPVGGTTSDRTQNAVTTGNGLIVAVGDGGTIITSTNGQTWTARSSGTTINFQHVTHGDGQFVAVGTGATIRTSTNGINWEAETSSLGSAAIYAAAHGGGQYVAVGTGNAIITSPDAQEWTQRGGTYTGNDVLGAGHGWIVAATGGRVNTRSPDGTWLFDWAGTAQTLNGITSGIDAAGELMYVAVGTGATVLRSPDGSTWETGSTFTPGYTGTFNGVAFGRNADDSPRWVAVGTNTPNINGYNVRTSTDGVNWDAVVYDGPTHLGTREGVAFGHNATGAPLWVVVGANSNGPIRTSQDGLTWVVPTLVERVTTYYSVAFGTNATGDPLWVTVGASGYIMTSPDALNWTESAKLTTQNLRDVTFGRDATGAPLWVVVGNGGLIFTSPDGETWTSKTTPTTQALTGIAYRTPAVPSELTSTITAQPDVLAADGFSTSAITVRAFDSTGMPLSEGGAIYCLASDVGTLSSVTGQGACPDADEVQADNNGDGTYSAVLTSTSFAAIARVTGTLGAVDLVDDANVEFVAPPVLDTLLARAPAADRMNLTWTYSGGSGPIGSIELFRNATSGFTPGPDSLIAATGSPNGVPDIDVAALSFMDTVADSGLVIGAPACYILRVTDFIGSVATSSEACPPVVTELVAQQTRFDRILLTWDQATHPDPADAVQQVRVHRGAAGGGAPDASDAGIVTLGATATDHLDLGRVPETLYCYVVTAVDDTGNRGVSKKSCDTTPAMPDWAPPTVTNLAVVPDGMHILDLTWTASKVEVENDLDLIRVYRGPEGGTAPDLTGPATATLGPDAESYSDTGRNPGALHCYVVIAFDVEGLSGASGMACGTTVPDTVPPVVAGLVANPTGWDRIALAWNQATDNVAVTSVEVHRGAAGFTPGLGSLVTALGASATTFLDTGLLTESTHCYRILARDAAGNVGVSGEQACATTHAIQPPDVTGLVASPVSWDRIGLTWTAVPGELAVAGIDVYRGAADGSAPDLEAAPLVSLSGTQVDHLDVGLTAESTYCYVVVARDEQGNTGPSTQACAETRAFLPPEISDFGAAPQSWTAIRVGWSVLQGDAPIAGFKVYRGEDGFTPDDDVNLFDTLSPGTGSIIDGGLSELTTHCYVVAVTDTLGNSDQSGQACATTNPAPAPGDTKNRAPVIVSVVVTPQAPFSSSPLTASISVYDPDHDPLTISYEWQLRLEGGGWETVAGYTTSTLPANATRPGQVWRSLVTASDGLLVAGGVSPGVVIQNTAPTVNVAIPSLDLEAGLPLAATVTVGDMDGDSLRCSYDWRHNGAAIPATSGACAGTHSHTLPGALTATGGRFTLTVTVSDGIASAKATASTDIEAPIQKADAESFTTQQVDVPSIVRSDAALQSDSAPVWGWIVLGAVVVAAMVGTAGFLVLRRR